MTVKSFNYADDTSSSCSDLLLKNVLQQLGEEARNIFESTTQFRVWSSSESVDVVFFQSVKSLKKTTSNYPSIRKNVFVAI